MHRHGMRNKDNLYKAVNWVSSIPFNINSKLLEYLRGEGAYLLDNYLNEKDANVLLSKDTTLLLAEVFGHTNFYLPVNCD